MTTTQTMTKTPTKNEKEKKRKKFLHMEFKLRLSFHTNRIVSLTDIVCALLPKHNYDRNTPCVITSMHLTSQTCFEGEVILSDDDIGIVEPFSLNGGPCYLETIVKSHPINIGAHHMLTVYASVDRAAYEAPYEVDLHVTFAQKIDTGR